MEIGRRIKIKISIFHFVTLLVFTAIEAYIRSFVPIAFTAT